MKYSTLKLCLLLTCSMLWKASETSAQFASPKEYVQLSTNPSSLIFGVFKLEVEIPLAGGFAIEPEVAVLSKGQRFWTSDYDTDGYRWGAVAKKYFDRSRPNEGYYGFAYTRFTRLNFTDYSGEGEGQDQRDFRRIRNTIGFGGGYTNIGKDGFYYGFALGVGRHLKNEKPYTSPKVPGPSGTFSNSNDSELFNYPVDIYGRVSVGFRLFNPAGRVKKDQFEAAEDERIEQRRELLLNRLEGPSLLRESDEVQIRRLEHRLRNGNG